jgi:hypothetical protein
MLSAYFIVAGTMMPPTALYFTLAQSNIRRIICYDVLVLAWWLCTDEPHKRTVAVEKILVYILTTIPSLMTTPNQAKKTQNKP